MWHSTAPVPSLASLYLHSCWQRLQETTITILGVSSPFPPPQQRLKKQVQFSFPALSSPLSPDPAPPVPHSQSFQADGPVAQRELRKAIFPQTGVSQLFLRPSSESSLCFCRTEFSLWQGSASRLVVRSKALLRADPELHLSAWILQSSLRSGPPGIAQKDLMGYHKGVMRTTASALNPIHLICVPG